MKNLLLKAQETNNLMKDELISLLSCKDVIITDKIFKLADKTREKYVGAEIFLRALIEFSNVCAKDCLYCGLRYSNKNIQRYSLEEDEILKCVENAVYFGYKTIVLQSGETRSYPHARLIDLIKEIKKFDVALTLSIGEKSYEEYKAYKEAGANRYLLRIETTDKELYKQMHPNSSFENRVNCLKDLKKLGYELGTGSLVGLPNQTIESLANDILFFKEIDADMIGIGPFISHPQTPLARYLNGDFNLALKVMALTRLLMPEINIPATTAMETLHKDGQKLALQAGANVVMLNMTTENFRQQYNIYPDKKSANPHNIKEKLLSIGRTIEMSRGNSLKWEKENKK